MSEGPEISLKEAFFSAISEKGICYTCLDQAEPHNVCVEIDGSRMAEVQQCLFAAATAHGWTLHKSGAIYEPHLGNDYHFHRIGANETDIRLIRIRCIAGGKNTPRRCLIGSLRRIFSYLQTAWKRPGVVMVIEGTDGSGKTTIIDGMRRVLATSYPSDAIVYYHWRPMFIASEIKKNSVPVTVCSEPHGKRPHGKVKSLLKLAVCTLDYFFGYWCKVRWQAVGGNIVVFDRYYYDFYLDQIRYRLQVSPGWLRFFQFFVPKPDISFALTGEAEAIWQRKKEMPLKEVQAQIDTLNHSKKYFAHTITVDVVHPIPEVVGRVSAEVLHALATRQGGLSDR